VRIHHVAISGEAIPLGQFLKLAGIALGGPDAKVMVEAGWVTVNGRVETQLGRQLRPGDLVAATGRSARVVTADGGPMRPNDEPWGLSESHRRAV
jgi:ribosome-associated protein